MAKSAPGGLAPPVCSAGDAAMMACAAALTRAWVPRMALSASAAGPTGHVGEAVLVGWHPMDRGHDIGHAFGFYLFEGPGKVDGPAELDATEHGLLRGSAS